MEKVMLAIICLMLCCGLGEAIHCYKCKRYKPGGPCINTEGSCITKNGNQCKEVHIYKEAVRNYFKFGCASSKDKCGTTKVDKTWGTIATKCCKTEDYCNDPRPH